MPRSTTSCCGGWPAPGQGWRHDDPAAHRAGRLPAGPPVIGFHTRSPGPVPGTVRGLPGRARSDHGHHRARPGLGDASLLRRGLAGPTPGDGPRLRHLPAHHRPGHPDPPARAAARPVAAGHTVSVFHRRGDRPAPGSHRASRAAAGGHLPDPDRTPGEGIRVGEAVAADRDDLDPQQNTLLIRDAKYGKQRLLPLHPSTTAAVSDYLTLRERLLPTATSPALLISQRGTRLLYSQVRCTFLRLVDHTGLPVRSGRCRPRIHDLRHSFAVATLLDWYRDHADGPALLPSLSTYLGHANPRDTYWYLSAAPELLALAADRLDAQQEGTRG